MAEEKNKRKKKRKEARLRKWALVRTEVLQALLTRQHGQDRNKQNKNTNTDRSSTANTARARPPGVITDSVRATSTSRRGPQWTRPMTAMPGPSGPRISRSWGPRTPVEDLLGDLDRLLPGARTGRQGRAPRLGNRQREAEHTRALYTQRLQKLLVLTKATRRRGSRRRKSGRGARIYHYDRPEASHGEEEAEGDYSGSPGVRRRLRFLGEEEEELDEEDILEREASDILPKTVKGRAMKLLKWLSARGKLSWRPGTHELVSGGIVHPGTNIIDLAGHAVRAKHAQPPKRGSPGPPPGFEVFAALLRQANAPRELVKNHRRWDMVYAPLAEPEEVSDADGNGSDANDGGAKAMGQEEDAFKTPPHTRQSPFSRWESSPWAEGIRNPTGRARCGGARKRKMYASENAIASPACLAALPVPSHCAKPCLRRGWPSLPGHWRVRRATHYTDPSVIVSRDDPLSWRGQGNSCNAI